MVALFTRAWIEIPIPGNIKPAIPVALFTRAWIEMKKKPQRFVKAACRPLHEGVD